VAGEKHMLKTITPTEARANFYQLIQETNMSHKPICIHGRHENAVLVAEEDWKSIQETLYLLSISGMREKILQGMAIPIEECSRELPW